MQKRFLMVLLFAFVVALGASSVVYRSVVRKLTASSEKTNTTILVAARDLPVGTLLRESDLHQASWGGGTPTPQSVTRTADALNRGVVQNIYRGEPILETRLAPKGAGAGLAATIPAGMRAVAVRVNDVVGVAGFIVPGMRVDVLVSGLPPGDTRTSLGIQTRTVLQNIEVLSVGHDMERNVEAKPATAQVVNLLVTPEQAEILSLAGNETKIQLVLRNPLDTASTKVSGTAVAYLFGAAPTEKPKSAVRLAARRPPAPAKPAPPQPERVITPVTVEVITGAKRDVVKVGFTVRNEAAK